MTIARLEGGLQRSAQTSAGVEVDLPSDITATATVFHQAFYDLNDALGTAQVQIIDIEKSDSLLGKSHGSAYGLELGVRRKLTRTVGGLVSYTLSRSERIADGRTFLSSYDRPHVFNAAISVDLGKGWRLGSRFVYYSGGPQTPATPAFPGQLVGIPPERTPASYASTVASRSAGASARTVLRRGRARGAQRDALHRDHRLPVRYAARGAWRPRAMHRSASPRTFGPVTVPSLGVEGGF